MSKVKLSSVQRRGPVNACPKCGRAEASLTYLTVDERDALVRIAEAAMVVDREAKASCAGDKDAMARGTKAAEDMHAALADVEA